MWQNVHSKFEVDFGQEAFLKYIGLKRRMTIDNFGQMILDKLNESPQMPVLCVAASICAPSESSPPINGSDLLNIAAGFLQGLQRAGFRAGDRIVVVSTPSLNIFGLLIACFVSGVVPVLVDQRYGLSDIKVLLHDLNIKCVIGPKTLLRMYWLVPTAWKLQKYCIDGRLEGCKTIEELCAELVVHPMPKVKVGDAKLECLISCGDDCAGKFKYFYRSHRQLINLSNVSKYNSLNEADGSIVTDSHVITLSRLANGQRSVLLSPMLSGAPIINSSETLNSLFVLMQQEEVVSIDVDLSVLQGLVEFLVHNNLILNYVHRVFVRAGKISEKMLESCRLSMPNAKLFVIYGVSEVDLVCAIEHEEFSRCDLTEGYLVGKPLQGFGVKIVKPYLQNKSCTPALPNNELAEGQAGEIVVESASLFFSCEDAWFRTGDYGFKDRAGNLWLTGQLEALIFWQGMPIEPYPIEKKVCGLGPVSGCALIQYQLHIALVLETDAVTACELKHDLSRCVLPIPLSETNVFVIDQMPTNPAYRDNIDRIALKEYIEESRLNPLYGVDVEELDDCCGMERSTLERSDGFKTISGIMSLLGLIFILRISHGDFVSAILDFILSLYMQIPVVIAASIFCFLEDRHLVIAKENSEFVLKNGLFRLHKDAVIVSILLVFGILALYPAEESLKYLLGNSPYMSAGVLIAGLLVGGGYLVGSIVFSSALGQLSAFEQKISGKFYLLSQWIDYILPAIVIAAFHYAVLDFKFEVCLIYAYAFPYSMLFSRYVLARGFLARDKPI